MSNRHRRWATLAALLALAGLPALAGCGSAQNHPQAGATNQSTARPGTAAPTGTNMRMRSLGTQSWQGMTVELAAMEPETFTLFQGKDTKKVQPSAKDDMHLMAVLSDAQNGARIPYASCWVTVTNQSGEIVVDERLWPMISRNMGTHYGVNVALPEQGTYTVQLRVDPPQAARHPAYAEVWTESKTFDYEVTFDG